MLDLGRTFLQSVERSGDACALVDGDRRLTYREWHDRIAAVAGGLRGLGLGRGDHLLVAMQNRWEMATLHWACQFLGIVVTPLNWRAKADEVDYCLADSGARALAFDPAVAEALSNASLAQRLPRVGVGQAEGSTVRFDDWLSAGPQPLAPLADAGDLSLMLYTSGTTGRPKGVPRTHRAERIAALAHVAQNCYRHAECTLGVMPLYHTMGVRSLLAMALVDGRLVCLPKFDAGLALAAIERERVTHLYLVPTLYHDMLAHPAFAGTDVSSVRKLGFAGAPMHDALLERLNAAFAPELFVNHYGSSEIYTFSIAQDAAAKPGSAGRAGINTRLRVVPLNSPSADVCCPPLQEGEIVADLAGDEAFSGYHQRPDANARSLRDGWYFTGDTGFVDQEGDLFVTGRVDDMIITGGENVSPVEIESCLSLHPAVAEVAVVGLPDTRWGRIVTAFVAARGRVTAAELDRHCRDSGLTNFKRPRRFVFVQEVPRSPVGKLLRRKLVEGDYRPADPETDQEQNA